MPKGIILNKKIAIYGVSNGVNAHPYLQKIGKLLSNSNTVSFYYWFRKGAGTVKACPNIRDVQIFGHGKQGSKIIGALYFPWAMVVLVHCLLNKKNTDFFIVSKLDTALPLFLVSRFFKCNYIYFDPDNVALSYAWPTIIKKFIQKVENLVSESALLHIVPGESRIIKRKNNTHVLLNTPSSELINACDKVRLPEKVRALNDLSYIYINGWFTWKRGFKTIFEAIDILNSNNNYFFVFAGNGDSSIINEICSKRNCIFIGQIEPSESLAICSKAASVVSLYDPSYEIHQFAEPNKWYDCIFTKTACIVNDDILAGHLFSKRYGFLACGYHDSKSLAGLMERTLKNPKKVEYINALTEWDIRATEIFSKVLN